METEFPPTGSLHKCPRRQWLGQDKARDWEHNLSLSCGCQGSKYLNHLPPLRGCISIRLEVKQGQASSTGSALWGLHSGAKYLPSRHFLNEKCICFAHQVKKDSPQHQ